MGMLGLSYSKIEQISNIKPSLYSCLNVDLVINAIAVSYHSQQFIMLLFFATKIASYYEYSA